MQACSYCLQIQTTHSFHCGCVCIFRWCMHSWPVRQTIFSQQPLKNSSLSFMPNCISGISARSRDSLMWCCTQYLSNWVLVLCYCRLIPHPSVLTRGTYRIKGQFQLFPALFLLLSWSIQWRFYKYNYRKGRVWIAHCSLITIQHAKKKKTSLSITLI